MLRFTASQPNELIVAGAIKWFDPVKGYGFVEPEGGGPDILLHANVLRNCGINSISDGSLVKIAVRRTEQGFQAFEVYSVAPPSQPDSDASGISFEEIDLSELVPARIKWFNREKGYGFANAFGHSEDIFVGRGILRNCGLADVQSGEAVSVRVEQGPNGQIASHVLSWTAGQPHHGNQRQSCHVGTSFDENE